MSYRWLHYEFAGVENALLFDGALIGIYLLTCFVSASLRIYISALVHESHNAFMKIGYVCSDYIEKIGYWARFTLGVTIGLLILRLSLPMCTICILCCDCIMYRIWTQADRVIKVSITYTQYRT